MCHTKDVRNPQTLDTCGFPDMAVRDADVSHIYYRCNLITTGTRSVAYEKKWPFLCRAHIQNGGTPAPCRAAVMLPQKIQKTSSPEHLSGKTDIRHGRRTCIIHMRGGGVPGGEVPAGNGTVHGTGRLCGKKTRPGRPAAPGSGRRNGVKLQVMKCLVAAKFTQDRPLAEK